jgi:hypothetical protein
MITEEHREQLGFTKSQRKKSTAEPGQSQQNQQSPFEMLELMKPLNTRQAEIVATLYAAWNNLLLDGQQPNDEAIVSEAREQWHKDKLKIERDKFFRGLAWMRDNGLVPLGKGEKVAARRGHGK